MSTLLFPCLLLFFFFLKCVIFICLFLIWTFLFLPRKLWLVFGGSLKFFFFFWELTELTQFYWVDLATQLIFMWGPNFGPPLSLSLSFLLLPPSSFLPPLTLFTLIFTLFFLLPLTIYYKKKNTFLSFSSFIYPSPSIFL